MKRRFLISLAFFFPFILFGQVSCSSNFTSPDIIVYSPSSGSGSTYQSWSAHIFYPADIGTAATLTALKIVKQNIGCFVDPCPATLTNQQLYMRHTTTASYPDATYSGTAGFTQVWNSSYTLTSATNQTITITFSTPFSYNGTDNLEILFENRSDVRCRYDGIDPWFKRTNTASPANRTKQNNSSTSGIFPSGAGVRLSYLPAVGLGTNCFPLTLPVDWLFFSGEHKNDKVDLSWTTASEVNNDYFTIKRSIDGKYFSDVGTVKGIGNSSFETFYSFSDIEPLSGPGYYRLKQTDFDGQFSYSAIIEIHSAIQNEFDFTANINSGILQFFVFNNLSQSDFHIRLSDIFGQNIFDNKMTIPKRATVFETPFPKKITSGIYFISIGWSSGSLSKKIAIK